MRPFLYSSISIFIFFSFSSIAGSDFSGHNLSVGYGFQKNIFRVNFSQKLWEEDLLFDGDDHAFAGFLNDHTWLGLDLNYCANERGGKGLFFGPELSYEMNLIYLQTKISVLQHFDLNGNYNFSIRPEIGLTMIGGVSLTYGYNWLAYANESMFNAPHNLRFTVRTSWIN